MELIIEELSHGAYIKLARLHEDFITEVHWRKELDTVTVIMQLDSSWVIRRFSWGYEIINNNTFKVFKLRDEQFTRMIIQ